MKKILFILSIVLSFNAFAQVDELRPDFKDMSEAYASFQRLKGSCGSSDNYCVEICSNGANAVMNHIGSSSVPVLVDLDVLWQNCYDAVIGVNR